MQHHLAWVVRQLDLASDVVGTLDRGCSHAAYKILLNGSLGRRSVGGASHRRSLRA